MPIASNHLEQVLSDSWRGDCHGDHIRRAEDGPSRCVQRWLGALDLTSTIHRSHQPPFERSVHLRRWRPYKWQTLGNLLLACESDGRSYPILLGAVESLGKSSQPSESPDQSDRDSVSHVLPNVSLPSILSTPILDLSYLLL